MSFDEEFPILDWHKEEPCCLGFSKRTIQKYCLDKERVKNAIEEIHISHRVQVRDLLMIQKQLKKRLGL